MEAAAAAGPIKAVYDLKADEHLIFLSEIDGTRIFRFDP